ncbi:K(+)-transporting ATPase subunit F (plasmid) [Sinorhizobium sp. M103]|nr:K(+)-transporting ATPase subunit F [Sinorhizobium sp. M103]WEJ11806.1 K(+)-transporting ATPase subunit F [Sinorhizobium sp. M103]
MVEALIGLVVGVALAAYLIVTLVRPERFSERFRFSPIR